MKVYTFIKVNEYILINNTNLPPVLPHHAVLVGDFNSHHPDWGYQEADLHYL